MRHAAKFAFLLFLLATVSSAFAAQKVQVIVHVPSNTPSNDSIYLAGSLATVGSWSADGVKLARQSDGTYTGEIDVNPGQTLEFKITRGDWDTVEKNADGSERDNRSATIDASTKKIEVTVEQWADKTDGPTTQP